jgi:hypothetical protein
MSGKNNLCGETMARQSGSRGGDRFRRLPEDDGFGINALRKAGKVAPMPVEMRSAERATESLADLKRGGQVRGRVVMTHE